MHDLARGLERSELTRINHEFTDKSAVTFEIAQ